MQDIGNWEAETGASYAHDDHADQGEGYADEADSEWRPEPREQRGHHGRMGHHGAAAGQPNQLAYSPAERAEWLSQCRALHVSYDEPVYIEPEDDADGGLIGGLLGVVAGGVIGNEVTNRHSLVGTLIGAGVGGLAGAVIGSVIDNADGNDDRRVLAQPQEPGFDYCEAYLINYERGYGTPQQVTYAPVMMMPVQGQAMQGQMMHGQMMQGHGARRMIIEEIDVEADEAPRHHGARRMIHSQPAGDKRTPIR